MRRFRVLVYSIVIAAAVSACDRVEDLGYLQDRLSTAVSEYDRAAVLRVAESIGTAELSSESAGQFVRLKIYSYSIAGELSEAESTVTDYLREHESDAELLTALGLIQEIKTESGREAFVAAYNSLRSKPVATADETHIMLELYVANWIPAGLRNIERIAVLEAAASADDREFARFWRDLDADGLIEYSPIGFVMVPYLEEPREAEAQWWE